MSVEIRRGGARFAEREPGRLTQHSFSFGPHYDPDRLSFGPMVCHDDHLLGAGRGFDTHGHRGLVIVSWVVSGSLRHTGDDATDTIVPTDSAAVFNTGGEAGVEHAEHATDDGPCRFVQVWLRGSDGPPAYDVSTPEPRGGQLVEVARPRPGAVFSIARLAGNQTLTLPAVPLLHAYVATGALLRFSLAEPLAAGDAIEMTDEPEHEVTAAVPTDLLVWTFDA